MLLGEALYESGGNLQYVYIPTTSTVSPLYVLEDGASVEIAVVRNEGRAAGVAGQTSRAVVRAALGRRDERR